MRTLLLFSFLSWTATHALDVLAASALLSCTNEGLGPSNCSRRLVITATLQNGESLGTGALVYSLSNAAEFGGSNAVTPADSVSLVVTQSAVNLLYPLTYLRHVNSAPFEQVVTRDAAGHAFSTLSNRCDASPASSSPACGWTVTERGARVPFSQGFCCACDISADVFGSQIPRSGLACGLFEQRDSAHCLRMGPLWYAAYRVGPPRLDFGINVYATVCRAKGPEFEAAAAAARANVTASAATARVPVSPAALANAGLAPALTCHAPGPGCECVDLDSSAVGEPLGPTNPARCFALPWSPPSTRDVCFNLEGTFVAYEGTPDFSSRTLLVPASCTGPSAGPTCYARLVESPSRWLLVGNEGVALDGSTCNRVGTSFEAFATQGSSCLSPAGTCLGGSPDALYLADVQSEAAGRAPLNFLSAFTAGAQPPTPLGGSAGAQALQSAAGVAPSLLLTTHRFQKTVVSLSLRADPASLRFVVNIARGKIVAVELPAFDAASTGGALTVTARSDGLIAATFTISVVCAEPMLPTPARQVVLAPTVANTSTTFALSAVGALGERAASGVACKIVLLDSLGGVSDVVDVNATVRPVAVTFGTQGGTLSGGGGTSIGAGNASAAGACGATCASVFDIGCQVASIGGCVAKLVAWASGAAGALAGMVALLLLIRNHAAVAAALRAIFACCVPARRPSTGTQPAVSVEDDSGDEGGARPRRRQGRGGGGSRRLLSPQKAAPSGGDAASVVVHSPVQGALSPTAARRVPLRGPSKERRPRDRETDPV